MSSIIESNLESLDRDFSVETHPYLVSNESEREKSIQKLSETKIAEGGFHIGFSCWENFNIMLARGSSGGLIADISNTAHKIHLLTRDCVLQAKTRQEFIELFPMECEQEGWLADDASFQKIQNLYETGKIHHIRMDITDGNTFQKVSDWMREKGYHCDSFYLSNIPDWFLNLEDPKVSKRKLFQLKSAINRVIQAGTYVIHSSAHFPEWAGMPQRVIQTKGIYDPVAVINQD